MTKRKQTGIEDMYYAIIRLEKKECTQLTIAGELGVSRTTVSKWMEEEQRAKIKKAYEENVNGQRKKLRTSKFVDLDITVFEWYKRTRALLYHTLFYKNN